MPLLQMWDKNSFTSATLQFPFLKDAQMTIIQFRLSKVNYSEFVIRKESTNLVFTTNEIALPFYSLYYIDKSDFHQRNSGLNYPCCRQ